MIGLLKKEFHYCKWYLLTFFIIYLVISLNIFAYSILPTIEYVESEFSEYSSIFLTLLVTIVYLFSSIPVSMLSTSYSFDERSNFDKFILASGIKRNTVITSKYIFTLICYIFPTILFLIITIVCFTNENINVIWEPLFMLPIIIAYISISCFISTMNILFMSRFGQMKQTVIMTILYIVFIAIIAGYLYFLLFDLETAYQSIMASTIIGCVLLTLSGVFVALTYQGYRKKEF